MTRSITRDRHGRIWARADHQNPCPVCGRTDQYCLIGEDGTVAICPRTAEGSHSTRGRAGYLHILHPRSKDTPVMSRPEITATESVLPDRNEDMAKMAHAFYKEMDPYRREIVAHSLGVTPEALDRMKVGWHPEHMATTWPMIRSGVGLCGIRYRCHETGRKWCESGSRNALFMPPDLDKEKTIFITEGGTDTATLLSLKAEAIGRPSNRAGHDLLMEALVGVKRVVIVIDWDLKEDTRNGTVVGAIELIRALEERGTRALGITPPHPFKDIRAWATETKANPGDLKDLMLRFMTAASFCTT